MALVKAISVRWIAVAFLSLSGAIVLSSCGVDETATSTDGTDDPDTDTETPTVDDDTGATVPDPINGFSVVITANDNYSIAFSEDGDGSSECSAAEGERIECIVDMNEHDLYINGLSLGWAAPQSQCDYLGQYHYFFARYPIGYMPTAVFATVNSEGTLTDIIANAPGGSDIATAAAAVDRAACDTDAGTGGNQVADIVYLINGNYYCHNELFTTTAVEVSDARCPWDYSKVDSEVGKNCCFGDYVLSTFDGTDPTTGENSWGDRTNYANCFQGPHLTDNTGGAGVNPFGITRYYTQLVPTAGLQDSLTISSPESQPGRNVVYVANYFDRDDHAGNNAQGVAALESIDLDLNNDGIIDNNLGAAFHSGPYVPGDVSATASAPINLAIGFPYYQIDCLDHDFELKAQIRVLIREWNTNSNFDAWLASPSDAQALATASGPDASGVGDPYSNGVDEFLDDYKDWNAYENGTVTQYDSAVSPAYFQLENNAVYGAIVYNNSDFFLPFPIQ